MAEAMPTKQAYYTSSYVFGNGTTSTVALRVWQAMSDHLSRHHGPMTLQQLADETGLEPAFLESLFDHVYYQKHYGFRRFDSLEDWEAHARENNVLFIPGVHDVVAEEEVDEDDESDESDDESDDEDEDEDEDED